MKIITVQLPESYTRKLENMTRQIGVSRSELIRTAVRDFLNNEFTLIEELKKENRRNKIARFFDYCINCERKIYSASGSNHFFHKTIEIFKLKFCCSCYKNYRDKTLDEFPEDLIEKIKKRIKAYRENSSSS
ncbi:MAG: CopG family transcriptional regulator [Candidatus Hodarchaeota archaeon]